MFHIQPVATVLPTVPTMSVFDAELRQDIDALLARLMPAEVMDSDACVAMLPITHIEVCAFRTRLLACAKYVDEPEPDKDRLPDWIRRFHEGIIGMETFLLYVELIAVNHTRVRAIPIYAACMHTLHQRHMMHMEHMGSRFAGSETSREGRKAHAHVLEHCERNV